MKTSSAKAKGRKFQQWVRDLILLTFPQLEPDDVRSTGMGQSGEDIQLSPAAKKLVPWAIECKCQEKLSIWASWEQATANAGKMHPVLFFTRNRSPKLAVVEAEYLMELLKNE